MLSNCDLDYSCKTCGYWIEVGEDIFDGKLVVKGACKYPYREMTRFEYEDCDNWTENSGDLSYS